MQNRIFYINRKNSINEKSKQKRNKSANFWIHTGYSER